MSMRPDPVVKAKDTMYYGGANKTCTLDGVRTLAGYASTS
jgi:hypothetical protein